MIMMGWETLENFMVLSNLNEELLYDFKHFDKWINMYFEVDRKILLGALEMFLEMFVLQILYTFRRKLTNKFERI